VRVDIKRKPEQPREAFIVKDEWKYREVIPFTDCY